MKRLFIALSAAALLAVLSVFGVMFFLSPPTEPGVTTPPLRWSPAHLVVTLTPGDAERVEAVATVRSDIPATSVRVVPSLAPYVSVEPSNLGAVSAGSERRFEFFFDVPLDTPLGTIDGTLHLVSDNATTSLPLPITLNIWPILETDEVTFSYPPTFLETGTVGELIITPRESHTFIELPVATPGLPLVGTFGISIFPNPELLLLEEWFAKNVDPDGFLTRAGTFQLETLLDGRSILVFGAPVPSGYDDGPLPFAYVISQTRSNVASITLSQDHDLHLLGYPKTQDRLNLLRTVAETIIVPN